MQEGYSPYLVVVKQGQLATWILRGDETAACSEEVIFGDFSIARQLPTFQTTEIEFTPQKAGECTFTCSINMRRGTGIVERA